MNKTRIITCVGSRRTPDNICEQMELFGKWCANNGIIIRSGHAPIADYAFEKGAGKYCIAILPWSGFNKNDPILGTSQVINSNPEYFELVKKYHPNYQALTPAARKLHARNGIQVLGFNLTDPSDAVVCWTPNANGSGGTGQALRIAKAYDISIYDMAKDEYNTADKITKILSAIWEMND